MATVLFKNVDYDAFSYRVVKNRHFQSALLVGGHKKEYSVYAFDNVHNNYGRPLTKPETTGMTDLHLARVAIDVHELLVNLERLAVL